MRFGPGGREFDAIRGMIARWGDLARGIGSDAASIEVPAGQRLVVSTDSSVERVHFRREWLTPHEIGYRATAAALSDLAAAAATPIGVLLAITVPPHWQDSLNEIADGAGEAVRQVETVIVGGDLASGEALALTVTVLGATPRPLSRAGARVGDAVYVTGTFGGPLAALRAWTSGTPPTRDDRVRFAHPVPRIREAKWLAERGATAAIDISDGLAADIGHIAAASGVRVVLELDHVPHTTGTSPVDAARSGEEYELAITAPPGLDTTAFANAFGLPLTQIGTVVAGSPGVETRISGARVDPPAGYNHFSL